MASLKIILKLSQLSNQVTLFLPQIHRNVCDLRMNSIEQNKTYFSSIDISNYSNQIFIAQ